ncbi:MAG: hypothetical protein Q7R96_03030 [Nanoarchaeota archaeon]|nr:hypothetical protein [Nanoarchaeota archaeon]
MSYNIPIPLQVFLRDTCHGTIRNELPPRLIVACIPRFLFPKQKKALEQLVEKFAFERTEPLSVEEIYDQAKLHLRYFGYKEEKISRQERSFRNNEGEQLLLDITEKNNAIHVTLSTIQPMNANSTYTPQNAAQTLHEK